MQILSIPNLTLIENFPNSTELLASILPHLKVNFYFKKHSITYSITITCGACMGFPLPRILVNLVMGYHEKTWISDFNDFISSFSKFYVVEISAAFNSNIEGYTFLHTLIQ